MADVGVDVVFLPYTKEKTIKDIDEFKEDLNKTINDSTMYYFTDNDFAGIDENGRKFSIIWLPVAKYDIATASWNYYGEKSSEKKFIGWDYCVEWYDINGLLKSCNSIRINLSNADCHFEPSNALWNNL